MVLEYIIDYILLALGGIYLDSIYPRPVVVSARRRGFLRGLQLCLRLLPDGLMHGGPPCSSWVWLNRGTSSRSAGDPSGAVGIEPSVDIANEKLVGTNQHGNLFKFLSQVASSN